MVKVEQKEERKKVFTTTRKVEKTEAEKKPILAPTEKVKVNNPSDVNEEEKGKIKEKLKEANPWLTDDQITVNNNGDVTVRYPDGSTNTLPS